MNKAVKIVGAIAGVLVLIQFVPYGCDQTNPEVTGEPEWVSSEVRDLTVRACYDCHSNETEWPWYSKVAPMRWLVYRDTMEGREHLNFSEFDRPQDDAEEAAEMVETEEMPLPIYLPLHPEARLTDAERQTLVDGYEQMFGRGGDEGDEDHEH
jgi:hypothetical protein